MKHSGPPSDIGVDLLALGAILSFPVHIRGGLRYVGDGHATQRDGELSGAAIDQRAAVTLPVNVIKGWTSARPGLETENFPMTICSARPLEDVPRFAYREPVRGISADYGFDEINAYMLLSQGRTHPARKHGRSENYRGCVDLKKDLVS
jgi:amidase